MKNLILNIFNIDIDDIENFTTHSDGERLITVIRLKKTVKYCPKCGCSLASNGFKTKLINHSALTHMSLKLTYEARRYRCMSCNYSEFERNPFAFPGFRNSILVMDQVMRDLHNPRYNYTMLADKYHISVTQIQNYFDSFVVIPHIRLPVNLGIDELHSNMAKRRNASYLGVLTNNDDFSLVEILPSRNKSDLNRCIRGSNAYYLLKSWNKLLLSDDYELDNEPRYNKVFRTRLNYRDLRDMILSCSPELSLAYELKERYRSFNSSCPFERAEEELNSLIADFQKANIKEYEEFVGILIRWRKEIINSFFQKQQDRDYQTLRVKL